MNRAKLSRIAALLAIISLGGVFAFIHPPVVFAQAVDSLVEVGDTTGLGSEDPKVIVARIIRTGLGFLGVIAVLLVLYGGFVWMTAGGNAEKVETAKKILIRAGIGLAIILLSFAVASFILAALLGATSPDGGGGGGGGGGAGGLGGGNTSSFTVTDYSPDSAVAIRNVQLRVTFSKKLDTATINGNIVITNAATGAAVNGTVKIVGNYATFTPSATCPAPNEDRFCFDADTEFTVAVKDDIKSTTGTKLVCSGDRCASGFSTGSLVDTEDPDATITVPESGDGISVDSTETVQVTATDDSEVSSGDFTLDGVQFDSLGATGEDLSNVTIESLLYTDDLVNGTKYKIGVTVTDIAGNTTDDSVTVTARPAWCFNETLDTDLGETGVDCGGDSTSLDYCGACDGSSCTEDAQCSSGSCVDGTCTTLPEITGVSPESGAVGTYVTISGTGFGGSTGDVVFTGEGGTTVTAGIPDCADGWSSTEVVVEVPVGAIDGPITLTTNSGDSDATNDDAGTLVDDFDVNDVVHPKLCSILPHSAAPTDALKLSGFDFGEAQDTSTVTFGDTAAGSYTSWADTDVAVTVPSVSDADYDVVITVDGVESNALSLTVEDDTGDVPTITGIDPSTGAIGEYVTISGTNFGGRTGTVWFTSAESGLLALASTDFPAACDGDTWSDDSITVIVPDAFQNEDAVTSGAYTIFVTTADGVDSGTEDFTIEDGEPGPGICSLTPDTGEAGDTVVIAGERLGSTEGTVTFTDGLSATITTDSWSSSEITVTVPTGVATGSVTVTSSEGEESNAINFAVGTAVVATSESITAASYGWYFTTGEIPSTPELVVDCTDTTVSGVPNERFTDAVCTNAVVYGEFTVLMDNGSVNDAVTVLECTAEGDQPCDTTTAVTGTMDVADSATATYFTFVPDSTWSVDTTYQVTVAATATSTDSVSLTADVSWTFTTAATDAVCAVSKVYMSPTSATIDTLGGTTAYHALPVSGCVVTDAEDYSWAWTVDNSYADFTISSDGSCDGGTSSCATVEGLAEGVSVITAEETDSAVTGAGDLVINFTDPYVDNYAPNCDEACKDALVYATFNTAMDSASVLSDDAVMLYTCSNELCTNLTEFGSYSVECVTDTDDSSRCTEVDFVLAADLVEDTYYRVIISGDVTSVSGVALTRANYHGDYSWTFQVKDGDAVCAVNRLSLEPEAASATVIGERQTFTASAFGEPDSCSVAGQELTATGYDWSWTNPIADDGDDLAVTVAEWFDGGVVDTDVDGIAAGCTTMCTAAGSVSYGAICGDGTVSTGEECEDGNTLDGDGCSSRCVHEGNTTTCGDGVVDSSEDCDDSNTRDGDGCSALCVNEGSQEVDATCGNGDIAYDAAIGGEDCDDGNLVRGDGCDTQCVNEGAPTLSSIGGAVCGNGTIDTPYENCDTGLTAEGCSDTCLLEGSSVLYTTSSTCGDTTIGTGEECDDGNAIAGDGCSDDCILEGSSTAYTVPSFCGDASVGTGELDVCESTGGDGNVDDLQLSLISDNAALEVDVTTHEANASIEVTEPTSGLTTTALYTLSCTAATDLDCPDETLYGVGIANCCMPRPVATLYPVDGATGVCRNSVLNGTFTTEMDTSSFVVTNADGTKTPNMYAVLDVTSTVDGLCPSSHSTMAMEPTGIIGRAWISVRRFFAGTPASATAGDCILPIVGYEQTANTTTDSAGKETFDGTYTVRMRYSAAMEANATYSLVIATDADNTDGDAEGVLSLGGVGVFTAVGDDMQEVKFTTGSDICALDVVDVEDVDTDSPGYFSQTGESHTFTATAYSYSTGSPVEITSIADVYAWEYTASTDVEPWNDDGDQAIVAATQSSTDLDQATVTASGENGSANVVATATITADVVDGTTGDTVSGTAHVTAYLCENPWPELAAFPWEDSDYNFSAYYCRDAGVDDDTSDDYNEVTAVQAAVRAVTDDNVMREYLFEVDGSTDAIGVRIVTNDDYLSPTAWYEAQGFTGTPSTTTIDGFEAITDGRTTYIAAANDSGAGIYSNIYVVSYNEGASDETVEIYDQFVENMSFVTNIDDTALCYDAGSNVTSDTCVSDMDCDLANGEYCGDAKGEITRDTKRLADLTTIAAAVAAYGEDNGVCSATVDKSCSSDSDCPDDETCTPVVPTLSGGTYVRSLGASAWTSWTDVFGEAIDLDDSVVDPLNAYADCGEGDLTSYDAATCVNATTGGYVCPDGSHVYHYRAVGSEAIELSTDLEYTSGSWVNAFDADSTDSVTLSAASSHFTTVDGFTTDYFCETDTVYGSTGTCGDGVVNTSEGGVLETCELGDAGGTASACDADGDSVDDGTQEQTCNATCSGWEDNTSATCVAASCGNAVVDSGEDCDDGDNNGRYNYCGADCMDASRYYCGDGELSGGEVCDCGAAGSGSVPSGARPYGGSTVTCAGVNGTYDSNPATTCAWDCQDAANYCGDATVDEDEGEQCDSDTLSWSGKLCMYSGSGFGVNSYAECTTDADCGVDSSCTGAECPMTTVCVAGGLGDVNVGAICDYDADCDTSSGSGDGLCSSVTYATTRTAACANDGESGEVCTVSATWATEACRATGSCGDGVVDSSEECDDGNDVSTDDCTNECLQNVCGDGYLYSGEEQCDDGGTNGDGCSSSYGSTCSACSVSCTYEVSSGDFCGDGEINGDEFCDAYSQPYYYYDAATDAVYGTCTDGDPALTVDSITYTCRDLGICNGGDSNGEYCTGDSSEGLPAATLKSNDRAVCSTSFSAFAGDCVKPTCSASCASSCPFSYDDTSVLLTSNQPGAASSNSVDMYTYSSSATSDIPNAATITIPACDAISAITADISLDNVTPPETYVVFVTDLSPSMDWEVANSSAPDAGESSRLALAQAAMETAIGDLYDDLGSSVQIGAVGFKKMPKDECYIAGTSCASASCPADDTCNAGTTFYEQLAFTSSSSESTVLAEVAGYFADNGQNGTPTTEALVVAKDMLDTVEASNGFENMRYIVILLTDGQWTTSDPATSAAAITDAGYELYTAAVVSSTIEDTETADPDDLYVDTVASWSSGNPDTTTGIDYAYDAQTEGELTEMFDQIISSILDIGITIISDDSDDDGAAEEDSSTVSEGTNVTLPWPSGFACDPNNEQELPVRFTFQGSGQIEVSNVQIDYCAP